MCYTDHMKTKAKKKKAPGPKRTMSNHVVIRMDDVLLSKLDALAVQMQTEQPFVPWNRSMIARMLIQEAFARREE